MIITFCGHSRYIEDVKDEMKTKIEQRWLLFFVGESGDGSALFGFCKLSSYIEEVGACEDAGGCKLL